MVEVYARMNAVKTTGWIMLNGDRGYSIPKIVLDDDIGDMLLFDSFFFDGS